jgi:alkylation response protein AidB-like acyl-CoA dehydrogenase
MDLAVSAEELAFRAELKAFIAENLTDELRGGSTLSAKEASVRWHKILAARGWGAPQWPKQFGGQGWSPSQFYIFEEEQAIAGCPGLSPFATKMVGPVIMHFGTKEQQDYWLPKAANGEHYWCQGYSEPGSGSDLAALSTKAVLDGDHYVVNGMKIWTSYAHQADWMFALVRTSSAGKQQEGITVLLINMKTPGISTRPLITIDGTHILNEVRFEDVRVPLFNRIGEENKGWTYAKFLLGNERALIAMVAASTNMVKRLKSYAKLERQDGQSLLDDQSFRHRLADVEIELEALRVTNQRVLYEVSSGTAGNGGAILKSKGTFISQALAELLSELVGYYGAPWLKDDLLYGRNEVWPGPAHAKGAMSWYMRTRANTIEGGTEEIQKNVIAKQVLAL